MGGAAGMSAGVVAATALVIPGVGAVFALGFGAAALFGLVGVGTGAAVGQGAAHDASAPSQPREKLRRKIPHISERFGMAATL